VLPPPPPAANQLVGTQEHGTKTIMGASGRFKGEPGGHGPRLCTFDNPEEAPYLRKNWKEITGNIWIHYVLFTYVWFNMKMQGTTLRQNTF